jgi:hypothetical protein
MAMKTDAPIHCDIVLIGGGQPAPPMKEWADPQQRRVVAIWLLRNKGLENNL